MQSGTLGLQTPRPVLLLPCCLPEQWPLEQVEHRVWSGLRGVLTSSRMLGRSFHLSEPQCPHLENGDDGIYHGGLRQGLGEIVCLGPTPTDPH